ncbi:MAG: Bro-N domain-containing protein [Nanoarchaeota archaeon]|nr:Bro-N domain-containing protein [Nanoarchaeota archaeon]MBU4116349.1 Bro-N domain-containing protein [Nanoarchaeota archaeon]
MKKEDKIIVFSGKKIRRIWHNNDWYFSVVDVVGVLTDSKNISDYIKKLKQRNETLAKGWGQIVTPLKSQTKGGVQLMNFANKQGIFRIIQSIPSKKAEPFKLWLAKVGSDRIDEIENPELAQERMKEIYEKKGYSKSWIDKRIRGIAVRQDLTDEWKKRGVKEQNDFAILTAEISNATFGMYPAEYKKFKRLQKENLRDHMTDLELIFSMLGEASTAEIERVQNPENFDEHKIASVKGGNIAKNARIELEEETRENIISEENYLEIDEKEFRKKKKKAQKIASKL